MSGSDFIHIGRVARAHGLKGALKVTGPWGLEGLFEPDDTLWLMPRDDSAPPRLPAAQLAQRTGARRLTLRQASRMGSFLIYQTDQVAGRDAAEALRNHEVYGPAGALERVQQAVPHPHDALGMSVVTVDGRELGEVVEVIATGAHDIYSVVDAGGAEVLLPAVEAFIKETDIPARRMVYDPPEGLLEINQEKPGKDKPGKD